MLTCIACSKQLGGNGGPLHDPDDDDNIVGTPSTRQAIKTLTAQIKDIALKASGAYRHCKPCSGAGGGHPHHHRHAESYVESSDAASGVSGRFHYAYRRAGDQSSGASTPRGLGFARVGVMVKGGMLSSGETTPASLSGRRDGGGATGLSSIAPSPAPEPEEEAKEWVAQVEPGVLITFVSLPQGGNDLKRIRFSREMFNKWQAQRWWAENYDKVMELYNVQRFNRHGMPLPTPPRSEDESSKVESAEDSPVTPPLDKERLPRNLHHHRSMIGSGGGTGFSSESLPHQLPLPNHHTSGMALASTPKLSSISGAKTETSSMDASVRTTSSSHEEADRSGELSVSNASDQETEWVEQDEPGVYITIRALPGGIRELRRVRFSRERFGEMHARLWWEENRARIHEQYL